jgi:antitoxin PrlF
MPSFTMTVTLNNEGQITIPEDLRTSLHLEPGNEFTIKVDARGDLILRRQTSEEDAIREANFDRAIGSADIKWNTDELMALLRDED